MWSICLLLLLCQEPEQEVKSELSPEQKAFFDKLFREGLFDPTGATWCKIATKDPLRPKVSESIRYGWVKDGKIYHVNGVAIKLSAHQQATPDDFLEQVKDCFKTHDERIRNFDRWGMAVLRGNIVNPPDLAMAAWCYRIGKEVEAAQLLSHLLAQPQTVIRKDNERRTVRGKPSTLDSLLLGYHFDMECICYHEMSRHFWLHEDRIALAHAEVMEKHFAKAYQHYPIAKVLVTDIQRRIKEGTADSPIPYRLPAEYDAWPRQKQIDYLIRELQEVQNYVQMSLADNYLLQALIMHDEAAIPALLNCIENDSRLLRTVIGQDFSPHQDVHYVTQAARIAIHRILKNIPRQDLPFQPGRTRLEVNQLYARHVRAFWEQVRNEPPLQRYYSRLQSGEYGLGLLAALLAMEQHPQWLDDKGASMPWPQAPATMAEPLAAFTAPTIAELILRDLDRIQKSLKPITKERRASMNEQTRRSYTEWERSVTRAVDVYLRALVVLGDRRVVPELIKREETQRHNFSYRRKLAMACHRLGDSAPLRQLCLEIAEGKEPVDVPELPQAQGPHLPYIENQEASDMFTTLLSAKLPESEQALEAIADPKHRLHGYFEHQLGKKP